MSDKLRIDEKRKVRTADYDPGDTFSCDKGQCLAETEALGRELAELQEWLYAAQRNSVLIILQGLDTSGKDGTIAHVFGSINPQGCAVASFKVPTPQEMLHDFLWRVHAQAPARGMITIFNRSHYEDVLVTRVHKLVDEKTCERRYEQIRKFEELLADNSTIVFKFFLHISKDEQEERLLEREKDTEKAWKLSAGDWHERQFWDDYQKAYSDAIGETAAKRAPWYIVPANHKWYRNYIVAKTLVETLREYRDEWEDALKEIGRQRLSELQEMRAQAK